jgi:hypothetical protein
MSWACNTCERENKCIVYRVLILRPKQNGRLRLKWIFCGLNLSEAEKGPISVSFGKVRSPPGFYQMWGKLLQ